MIILILLITLMIVSAKLTHNYIKYAWRLKLVDIPNQRSSHQAIVPRGGGLIFVVLWLLVLMLLPLLHLSTFKQAFIFFPGALLVAGVGFIDDKFSLPASWRAVTHLLAAIITLFLIGKPIPLTFGNITVNLGWLGMILFAFAIVWSINLYNFMDGIDAIASIEVLFILGVGGVLLWRVGGYDTAIIAWALVACILGFLCWNWPPAKVFMGDVGSAFLGFVVAVFAIVGQYQFHLSLLTWIMLYGIFLFDASVTLVRRMLAGERWYEAHKSHAYQRLHQAGWSHRKIVLGVIIINSLISVIILTAYKNQIALFSGFIIEFIGLVLIYKKVESIKPMYLLKD